MFSHTLNTLKPLLAVDPGQQMTGNPTGETIKLVLYLGVFVLMMYFLMIRPQQKKAREHDTMMKGLRPGDKVVTSSGIIGVVLSIKEKSVSLRSADTKLEVLKSAIAEITERSEAEKAEVKS